MGKRGAPGNSPKVPGSALGGGRLGGWKPFWEGCPLETSSGGRGGAGARDAPVGGGGVAQVGALTCRGHSVCAGKHPEALSTPPGERAPSLLKPSSAPGSLVGPRRPWVQVAETFGASTCKF